jgi:uncharacterized SAM-binding protein YcdF (DUF218 family)
MAASQKAMTDAPGGPVRRVIVVLGYSNGSSEGLHPVCAARLAFAAKLATADDVVVLSGWARSPGTSPEAELMRDAWAGSVAKVVVDPTARTTVENALNAVDDILGADAREVLVVTSRWHAARARTAFRLVLRGRGITVHALWPDESSTSRQRVRELGLWPVLPLQVARAAAHRRRR